MPYEAQSWGFDPNADPGGTERAEQGIAWLRHKWGEETSCPYCGGTDWNVTGPFRLLRHTIQGRPSGSEPNFEAICRGCGNTVFIDGSVVNAAGD
jgi:hypothetical protein